MNFKMNWFAWFHGLIAAVISSAAGAVAVIIVEPQTFNLGEGLVPLLKVMAVFAIVAAGNYLKSYPTPAPWEQSEETPKP